MKTFFGEKICIGSQNVIVFFTVLTEKTLNLLFLRDSALKICHGFQKIRRERKVARKERVFKVSFTHENWKKFLKLFNFFWVNFKICQRILPLQNFYLAYLCLLYCLETHLFRYVYKDYRFRKKGLKKLQGIGRKVKKMPFFTMSPVLKLCMYFETMISSTHRAA